VVRGYSQEAGSTTKGSTTIANLASTSGLLVGQPVFGAGIPNGSTVASIVSASSITVSQAATATGAGVALGFGNGSSAATHAATAVINMASGPAISPKTATITVADAALLSGGATPNFIIQIDQEQMLVTALNLATNTLTVERGYNSTAAAAHFAGAPVSVQPTLASAVDGASTSTTLTVSDVSGFAPANGFDPVIQIDNEQMLVTSASGDTLTVVRGFNNSPAAPHSAGALVLTAGQPVLGPTTTTIPVANAAVLSANGSSSFVIRVDQEQMHVTKVNLAADTLTVVRGYNGTTPSTHAAGANVLLQTPALPQPSDYEIYLTQGATTQTGKTTAGSNAVTGLASTVGLSVGEAVTGSGIPASTTITAIPTGSSITISSTAIAAASVSLEFGIAATESGKTTAGSSTINGLTNATQFVVGEPVSGPGIPSGTTIASIISASAVTVSRAASVTVAGAILTFGMYQATLYDLDTGDTLGQANFAMPPGVANLELEGGPGKNLIQVDSSVSEDISLYGGPGQNTLKAGSGDDTLVAGPGTSVLYGGAGADVLYGGDLPQQDATPVLDPYESWSNESGSTTDGSETITGLATTSGLTSNQLVSGSGIPVGSVITGILSSSSITISQPATFTAGDVTIAFGSSTAQGRDTLIAGSGSSELYAGTGNDLLIGGSATLENNQWVLQPGAGRDLLEGGAGNDLLVIGPGSPGSVLLAGSGTATLAAQNDGSNVMVSTSAGKDVFLGYAGSTNIDASGSSGNDTLVGGYGFNSLFGGSGTNYVYDYPDQASWSQAVKAAATDYHVELTSPLGPSNASQDPVWEAMNTLETEPQNFTTGSLAAPLEVQLQALGVTDTTGTQIETQLVDLETQVPYQGNIQQLVSWLDEDPVAHRDLEQILLTLQQTSAAQRGGLSHNQQYLWRNLIADDLNNDAIQELQVTQQIKALAAIDFIAGSEAAAQFAQLANESYTLSQAEGVDSKLLGAPNASDTLLAGNGTDYLYGNPSLPTWMAGGYGADTFYNLNDQDTILGGAGDHNTLMFDGDGTYTLQPDATNPSIIDVGLAIQKTSAQAGFVNGTAITDLLNTAGLSVGEAVSGAGIPSGTTITAIGSATGVTISNPGTIADDEDLTFTDTTQLAWQAGNFSTPSESMTNIQVIAVQTGNANGDSVAVDNLSTLPAGLTGLSVQAGNGNGDMLDASTSPDAPISLLAGAGADIIRIAYNAGPSSYYVGNSLSELDVVDSDTGNEMVTMASNLLTIDGLPINSQTGNTHGNTTIDGLSSTTELSVGQSVSGNGIPVGDTIASIVSNNAITIAPNAATTSAVGVTLTFGITFHSLKVIAGPASGVDTFTVTNSTVSNVVFLGGPGTNSFTAGPGTAQLIGGPGSNSFTLNGPGTYTIDGDHATSNSVTFNSSDTTNGDSITLAESDYANSATVTMKGTISGSPLTLTATSLNPSATSITVHGGSGAEDSINAAAMNMGVTLNSGGGPDDGVTGGRGNNIVYFAPIHYGNFVSQFGPDSSCNGGTGTVNEMILLSSASWPLVNNPGTLNGGESYNLTYTAATNTMSYSSIATYSNGEQGDIDPFSFSGSVPAVMSQIGLTGFEKFQVLNSSTGTLTPVNPTSISSPLSPGTPTVAASGGEAALSENYIDPNGQSAALTNSTTINWGDGTSTSQTGASQTGAQSFNVQADHLYGTSGSHTIMLAILDGGWGAATASASFIGGLALNGGALDDYVGTTATQMDTGVVSYLVQNKTFSINNGEGGIVGNVGVFSLHGDGTLELFIGAGSGAKVVTVDTNLQNILLGPDGNVYALHRDGTVYAESTSPTLVPGKVQQMVQDASEEVFTLMGGSLYLLQGSGPAWPGTLLLSGVESIALAPSGTSVNVVQDDGESWAYSGTRGAVLGGPQFYFSPLSATVGQPATVTLNVLDQFGNPLTGYTGTVQFATSDAAAVAAGGPLPQHTFRAADNGSFTFTTTFLIAGTQTLTATDSAGDGTQVNVTVAPGAVASLQVAGVASAVAVNNSLPVTVTAYDAEGNVATNFIGTIALAGSDPFNLQYKFTPRDNGEHTFFVPFSAVGSQSVTASDTANTAIAAGGSFVVNPDAVDVSQCTIAVSPATVSVGSTATISMTARDGQGNQETSGGLLVSFSVNGTAGTIGPVTDDGDGTYTATFTPGPVPGTYSITATINGQPLGSRVATITDAVYPNGTVTNATPSFAWPVVPGASSYALAVTDTTTKKVAVNLVHITATAYTLTPSQALTPGHSYAWTAEGISTSGHLTVVSSNIVFTVAPLGAPTAAGPSGPIATDLPTFTWSPVTDAAHPAAGSFSLKVIDNITKKVLTVSNITGISYTLSTTQALTPGDSYTWSVSAVSSNGQSTVGSSSLMFAVAPLAAPGTYGPTGASNTDTPTFVWVVAPGTTTVPPASYTLKMTDKSTGKVLSIAKLRGTSYTLTAAQALTPGHSYTWSVAAVSTNGLVSVASSGPKPTVTIDPLAMPTLSGPTGTLTTDMPTFTWASGAGAGNTAPASYTLKVTDKLTGQVLTIANLKGTSYTLTTAQALTPGRSYTWSVTAVSTNGQAALGSASQTLAVAPLAAPVLIGESGGAFSWPPATDANHYAFQIKDGTTGAIVANVPTVTGTSYALTSAQAALLKTGHGYTWLVASVSTNGKVIVWSGGKKFTAPA
jgi:hypothetical protein